MDLGSSLFSLDYINLKESDQFGVELEDAIRSWNLSLDQLNDLTNEKIEKDRSCSGVKFMKCFNLSFKIILIENDRSLIKTDYKQLLESVLSKVKEVDYYYSDEANFIQRTYGLTNFILIQTTNPLDVLQSEQIIKLINSAISCAITNTKCIYPILVQIKDQVLELSTGLYINFGIKINYDSAFFDLNQFNSTNVADFLKIFENKLKRNLQLDDNVRCFLANRRCLSNYTVINRESVREQLDDLFANDLPESLINEFQDLSIARHLGMLRFELKHTEVLPKIQGTQWTFSAEESILKDFQKPENGCLSVRIDHLDPSPVFRSIFYDQEIVRDLPKEFVQLKREQIQNLHEFQKFCNHNFSTKQDCLNYFLVKSCTDNEFIDNNLGHFKSTPFDSIVFRFAFFVFNLYSTRKLVETKARILDELDKEIFFEISDYWNAIVDQLRRYWELCELIPCVEDRAPDLNSCLLTQKIQMLNCCIKEKQKREAPILNHIKEEEEDEFFDCHTDLNGEDQADGRLEKLELTLLNSPKKAIYKPITQELTPYTEDNQEEYLKAYSGMNFEDDENLENIEDPDQFLIGKNILLVSDMEAFKAANPECCFDDFIHWYSPKDFIEAEYDEQTGQLLTRASLSERFQSSNCLWRKIWQVSKAVPIAKQKRIFNYSMEAERALDYLHSIKFEDLMSHLFSTRVQIGCWKYKQIIDGCLFKSDELAAYFDENIKQIARRSKVNDVEGTSRLLIDLEEKVFDHLGAVYLLKCTPFNLRNAQPEQSTTDELYQSGKRSNGKADKQQLSDKQLKEIVNELAKNRFYRIRKDDESALIVFNGLNRMFNLRQLKATAKYTVGRSKEKEFTFVADCARPAKYSRKIPQKLNFKVCSDDESRKLRVRMNGIFGEDIVYF